MTVTQNTTAFLVHKRHGYYTLETSLDAVLDEVAASPVRLRAGGGMRRGVLSNAEASWPITVTNRWRTAVTVGSGDTPLIRLGHEGAYGPAGPVDWSMGRGCHATVRRGADRITVSKASRFGSKIRVEVVGTWPDLDLMVLSAAFAVMSWRRGKQLRTMAIVAAISHH